MNKLIALQSKFDKNWAGKLSKGVDTISSTEFQDQIQKRQSEFLSNVFTNGDIKVKTYYISKIKDKETRKKLLDTINPEIINLTKAKGSEARQNAAYALGNIVEDFVENKEVVSTIFDLSQDLDPNV